MKRLAFTVLLLFVALPALAQESLGDIARRERANKKPPAKVFTNDDLAARTGPVNVVGVAPAPDGEPKAEDEEEKAAEPEKDGEPGKAAKGEKAAEEKSNYPARYQEQKNKVEFLQRELDVLQRELRLSTAAYYADAGVRFRDEKNWAEQNRKYHADIAAKQKELADARAELEDLTEDARRSGLSTGALEQGPRPDQP
ncbi:MAG: hypothetical protein ACE14L_04265 [Terriglobales bacterium]